MAPKIELITEKRRHFFEKGEKKQGFLENARFCKIIMAGKFIHLQS